jgi:hypothetical protein
MDCLDNFIGLKNCSDSIPESGYYINGLPGMSTELVDNIANSEQVSYAGVWSAVKSRAFMRLKDDVINYLYNDPENKKPVNFNQVIYQTKRLTKKTHSAEIVSASSTYNGVYVKLPESKYLEFYFREIYIYSDQEVTTTVKVWDINDGTVLYEQETELLIGFNAVLISQSFLLKYGILELFIGVDTTEFNSIKTNNDSYYWYDCNMLCCSDDGSITISEASLTIGNDATFDNIDRNGSGKGIAIGADVRCSIEDFICENRKLLTRAIWYLLACEMLMEKIGSPRLNYFTASNLEQTNYLMLSFKSSYKSALKTAIDTIPIEKSICFDCDDLFDVSYQGNMP